MIKKILSVILVLIVLIGTVGCSKSENTATSSLSNEDYPIETIDYLPLYAGDAQYNDKIEGAIMGRTTDVLLYDNPDRGFRTTVPIVTYPEHPDPEDPSKTTDTCDLIIRHDDGRVSYNYNSKCKHDVRHVFGNLDHEAKKRAIDYSFQNVYLKTGKTDYNAKLLLMQGTFYGCNKSDTLPDYIFEALDIYFDNCRKYGIRILFRYGYHAVQLDWQYSEANRQEHLKYGADEETMISHIKQLAPYIGENLDVIHKLSSGFIGSGGEQAYAYQYPVVNYDNIIKAVMEYICVPYGLYYTVRIPKYKLALLENDPDYEYAHLIGHNNDAFYGEQEHLGWHSECYQYNHNFTSPSYCNVGDYHIPNDWWNYVNKTAAYTPQSGEMYHTFENMNVFIKGYEAILQLAHHRYTTISQWNSYIESGYTYKNGKEIAADTVMQRWINDEQITQEWLKENNIVYDPAWFYDKDGNEVFRNPFEFIRDHLGYRVQAQSLEKQGSRVKLTLKNYGFTAAFTLESGFAILDSNYNLVTSVKAGSPATWYSHDPENYMSDVVLEHTVEAEISAPDDGKIYYLAFYLKNDMGQFAKLANDDDSVPYVGEGYNVLYKIEN